MGVRFYPKALLVTVVFLAAFGATLALADEAGRGLAIAGAASIVAYLVIELGLTFNPAIWRRRGRRADQ
jgi:hypothetical protein